MNKTSITIGNEYDKELILVLSKVLQDLNAIKIDENTGLAGSQDLYLFTFDINGDILTIEIETYIGISLIGSKDLIEEIKNRIDMETASR